MFPTAVSSQNLMDYSAFAMRGAATQFPINQEAQMKKREPATRANDDG